MHWSIYAARQRENIAFSLQFKDKPPTCPELANAFIFMFSSSIQSMKMLMVLNVYLLQLILASNHSLFQSFLWIYQKQQLSQA